MNKHPFTDEELGILLEAARVALGRYESFTRIANELDLSDDELKRVADKLETYANV